VEAKFKGMLYPVLVFPSAVPEMVSVTKTEKGLRIGSSVTLSNMEDALRKEISSQPGNYRNFAFVNSFFSLDVVSLKLVSFFAEYKTRIYTGILGITHYFAGRQIRNAGVSSFWIPQF